LGAYALAGAIRESGGSLVFFGESGRRGNLRLNRFCLLPNYYYILRKGSEFQDGVWYSKKERD
jgi:hypothetical protein